MKHGKVGEVYGPAHPLHFSAFLTLSLSSPFSPLPTQVHSLPLHFPHS